MKIIKMTLERASILILCISFIIQLVISIETIILHDLNKADQQTLFLAKQTSNIIRTQKKFNLQDFTCLTILPLNLTKYSKEKVHKLNLTFHHENKNQEQNPKEIKQTNLKDQIKIKQIVGFYQDYDYQKILDLLHGTCAIHETNQFLYEYCHKQKVRQFDSILTKERMAKTQYEDIALGYYDYEKSLKDQKEAQDMKFKVQSQTFKIEYDQKGQFKILNTILQNFPTLSTQDRDLLKQAFGTQPHIEEESSNLIGKNGQAHNLNQKINQENQNLGLKGNQKHKNLDESTQSIVPEAKIIVQTIPMRSSIYDKENLFTVKMVSHQQHQIDKQNKVIHLNYPIINTNKIYLFAQIIHQVTCEFIVNSITHIYISKATVISTYQLAFHGNISKCHRVVQISNQPLSQKTYSTQFHLPKIRILDNFLYGQIQAVCTNNWDWSMKEPYDFLIGRANFLQKGSLLQIGITYNNSGKPSFDHYNAKIKQFIAPGVVRIQSEVGKLFQSAGRKQVTVGINNCRIISNQQINEQSQTNKHKFLNEKIIRLQKGIRQRKSGDQLLCLLRIQKIIPEFLQIHLTLGKRIVDLGQKEYFQYYRKNSVNSFSKKNLSLLDVKQANICYDIIQNEVKQEANIEKDINQNVHQSINTQQQKIKNQKEFTQLVYLNSKNSILTSNLETDTQIFLIDISDQGILKIHTLSQTDQHFFFLVTPISIIKVKIFPNNTREIVRENSFYQNSTYQTLLGRTLFIHQNFIWRGNDKITFPRLNFLNQKITKIQRVSGVAYIKKFILENFKFKQSTFYLSSVNNILSKHHQIKKYPLYQKNQQKNIQQTGSEININNAENQQQLQLETKKQDFSELDFTKSEHKTLNQSVMIRYQYFDGELCGSPINKNRRTDVFLQCGQPWLKIEQVKQISPCFYELKVSTRLLCKQNFKSTIQKLDRIPIHSQSRISLQKSMVCYPKNSWDNVKNVYNLDQLKLTAPSI